jgi:hypothetical protein
VSFEDVDGSDEVGVFDEHHEVDGIEVSLAVEAATKVRVGIDGREELTAVRAEKAEAAFTRFVRPLKMYQEVGDGDFVP